MEINIRAFSNGQMEYSGEKIYNFSFWKWCAYDSDTIYMLGTGRVDCNNVQIYQGDIIKSHEHIYSVIWRDDLCGFGISGDKSRMNLSDWLENGQYSSPEIIGNIYENPNLLK